MFVQDGQLIAVQRNGFMRSDNRLTLIVREDVRKPVV